VEKLKHKKKFNFGFKRKSTMMTAAMASLYRSLIGLHPMPLSIHLWDPGIRSTARLTVALFSGSARHAEELLHSPFGPSLPIYSSRYTLFETNPDTFRCIVIPVGH